MAEFLPFRGFLYNLEKVKDISNVISPPWDLIDDEIEKKLISLSEYNIVKLIRKENNPEEVKKTLSNWLKNKILIQDGKEYFYFLKSKFEYDGKIYERKGIIGILGVEDFEKSKIIPHEKIFPKYSNNRYKLIEISRANFCPIFMLYQDKEFQVEKIIEKGKVYFKGKNNGENIEFGKIKEKEDIEKIKEILKEKIIFIADGHHRFYASFNFYKNHPSEINKYALVYLSNIESDGVMILPTHRYIPIEINLNFNKEFIEVSKVNNLKEMEEILNNEDNVRKIGMLYNESFYILKFKNLKKYFKGKDDYIELDSFLVDNFLINELIEIKENTEFFYHSSKEYLIKEYEKRKKGVIFFLRPVKKSIFIKMCLDGKIMPQKTTYFYPKVPSGLVIYKF